jgi:excisionase family DNA binding protein
LHLSPCAFIGYIYVRSAQSAQNAQEMHTPPVIDAGRGVCLYAEREDAMPMKVIPDPDDRLLTRSEVAEIFQVSPSTVTRWAEAGKLPSVKTLGGHRRYESKAVMALAQQLMKEEASMENALFDVPSMYGDHHVIAVRQALLALPGVEEVWASSAWQQVQVAYEPETVSPDQISQALVQAGYPIGNGHLPSGPSATSKAKDPAWDTLGARVTQTNQVDLKLSGEFRRY